MWDIFPSLFQSCLEWKPMTDYFQTISIRVCLLAMNTVLSVAFVIVRHSTFRVEIVMRSTTRSEQHGGVGGKNKRAFWPWKSLSLQIHALVLPPRAVAAATSLLAPVGPSENDLNQRGLFRSGGWLWNDDEIGWTLNNESMCTTVVANRDFISGSMYLHWILKLHR